jgi:hypothetical protein
MLWTLAPGSNGRKFGATSEVTVTKNVKQTQAKTATLASNTLKSGSASAVQMRLAGSALAQAGTGKQTGKQMESVASRALDNQKSNSTTKALAGSVISQSNKKR